MVFSLFEGLCWCGSRPTLLLSANFLACEAGNVERVHVSRRHTPTTTYLGYVRSRRGPLIDDPPAERLVQGWEDTNRGQLSRDSKQRWRLADYQLVTAPS